MRWIFSQHPLIAIRNAWCRDFPGSQACPRFGEWEGAGGPAGPEGQVSSQIRGRRSRHPTRPMGLCRARSRGPGVRTRLRCGWEAVWGPRGAASEKEGGPWSWGAELEGLRLRLKAAPLGKWSSWTSGFQPVHLGTSTTKTLLHQKMYIFVSLTKKKRV